MSKTLTLRLDEKFYRRFSGLAQRDNDAAFNVTPEDEHVNSFAGSVSYMGNMAISHRPQPGDFTNARFPESELRILNSLLKDGVICDVDEQEHKALGWEPISSYHLTGTFTNKTEQFGMIEVITLIKTSKHPTTMSATNVVRLFLPNETIDTSNPAFTAYVTGDKFWQTLVKWNQSLTNDIRNTIIANGRTNSSKELMVFARSSQNHHS